MKLYIKSTTENGRKFIEDIDGITTYQIWINDVNDRYEDYESDSFTEAKKFARRLFNTHDDVAVLECTWSNPDDFFANKEEDEFCIMWHNGKQLFKGIG